MSEWIECQHGIKIEYCRSCAADHFQKRAEAAEAQRDALAAQLETVTSERNRFADELAARGYKPRCTCTMDDNMHEPQCAITGWVRLRFERTAPVDWRDAYQGETPLGIALDDSGDVEP